MAATFTRDAIHAVGQPQRQGPVGAPRASMAAPADAGGFTRGRRNWGMLAAIAAGHAGVIALLLTTGAIRLGSAPPPVAMTFVQEIAAPLEPSLVPEAALDAVPTDIFMPEVLVETSVTPPPTVSVAEVPPPPSGTAAPVPVRGEGDAPIVPPDFSADQLNNAGPRYPSASRRAHEEGTVMLKVLVAPDGRAEDLMVATSSGFARLDDAALDTVRRWAFLPAKQAGRPVSAWVLVPVTFELGDGRSAGRHGRGRSGGPAPQTRDPAPTAS